MTDIGPCGTGMTWIHVVIVALQVVQSVVVAMLKREVKRNGHSGGVKRRRWWG